MDIEVESKLVKNALKLKEIEKLAVGVLLDREWNPKRLRELFNEHNNLKKEIKVALIDFPVAKIRDRRAQKILQKISAGEPLPTDERQIKIYEHLSGEKFNVDDLDVGLDNDEAGELGMSRLYEWWSHYEYIEGLYEIGSLIMGITVPAELERLVNEARHCYAFQQYMAVYSLCRTILEVSIRDIAFKRRLIREDEGNVAYLESRRLVGVRVKERDLIRMITQKNSRLRDRINEIYTQTSILIHGRKPKDLGGPKEVFKETLSCIHDLYAFHKL